MAHDRVAYPPRHGGSGNDAPPRCGGRNGQGRGPRRRARRLRPAGVRLARAGSIHSDRARARCPPAIRPALPCRHGGDRAEAPSSGSRRAAVEGSEERRDRPGRSLPHRDLCGGKRGRAGSASGGRRHRLSGGLSRQSAIRRQRRADRAGARRRAQRLSPHRVRLAEAGRLQDSGNRRDGDGPLRTQCANRLAFAATEPAGGVRKGGGPLGSRRARADLAAAAQSADTALQARQQGRPGLPRGRGTGVRRGCHAESARRPSAEAGDSAGCRAGPRTAGARTADGAGAARAG